MHLRGAAPVLDIVRAGLLDIRSIPGSDKRVVVQA